MERTAAIDVDADACPCCGVMIDGPMADEVGTCELCAGFPFSLAPSCCGKHGDELRINLLARVAAGFLEPLRAMALIAIDDAHRAGGAREHPGPTNPRWEIDRPAPDPTAWDRIARISAVDSTIRAVVAQFVRPGAWNLNAFRRALTERLSALSRRAGCDGIWKIAVASPTQIDIEPPTDYIQPDTKATRRRDTIDGLVREALVT